MVLTIKLARAGKKIKTGTGTKEIVITFGGEDLTNEVDKLLAEITGVANSKESNFNGVVDAAVTASHYTKLMHLKLNQTLSASVSISSVKIETRLSVNMVVVTVELTKANSNGIKYSTNTKDVSITFLVAT